jgi:hypothetical protein
VSPFRNFRQSLISQQPRFIIGISEKDVQAISVADSSGSCDKRSMAMMFAWITRSTGRRSRASLPLRELARLWGTVISSSSNQLGCGSRSAQRRSSNYRETRFWAENWSDSATGVKAGSVPYYLLSILSSTGSGDAEGGKVKCLRMRQECVVLEGN